MFFLGLSEVDAWNSAQLDSLVDMMNDVFGGLYIVLRQKDDIAKVIFFIFGKSRVFWSTTGQNLPHFLKIKISSGPSVG